MNTTIKNKSVVITGGAEGIGYHIADHLLQNGAKTVIILDINKQKGTETEKILRSKYGDDKAKFIKCDVTKDLEAISKNILEEYSIDILVNNAGTINDHQVRKLMEINAIGCMEWTLKFFEAMRTDKGGNGGTILNIASVRGFRVGPNMPCYSASKSAVLAFTKCLGHEYNFKKYGVRVMALCPGTTATTMRSSLDQLSECLNFEEFSESLKNVPGQKPEVVGEAAVDVIEKAESGTVWVSEDGKPVEQLK